MWGRCVRGSLAASALSAAETTWARALRSYELGVTRFVCPSRFMADRMADGGWNLPVDIVPNPAPLGAPRAGVGEGFVVVGRLVGEKGVSAAAEAARGAGANLCVAGDGPLLESLRAAYPEVAFVGRVDGPRVDQLIRDARAVLVPSLVFENASMAVLEAMGAGVPVIASRVGGTPELLTDGVEGMLVPPGDVGALAAAMRTLGADRQIAAEMGASAWKRAARDFTMGRHMTGIVDSYSSAIMDVTPTCG